MSKHIQSIDLSPTLWLSECTDGWWLYDDRSGMNLAMRAATERAALTEALEYYQNRCSDLESKHKSLHDKVSKFMYAVVENPEDVEVKDE